MIVIENVPNPQILSVNTDFNIRLNPALKVVIEQIEGVEELEFFGLQKYSFIVCFGKAFDREYIKEQIEKKMSDFIR